MSDDPDDYGYCNACGEEALLDTECCDDGEVVEYDPLPTDCFLCGNPATGLASTWSPRNGTRRFCHGDDDTEPTCYEQASRMTAHDATAQPLTADPFLGRRARAVCHTTGCLYASPPSDPATARDAARRHVRATEVQG